MKPRPVEAVGRVEFFQVRACAGRERNEKWFNRAVLPTQRLTTLLATLFALLDRGGALLAPATTSVRSQQ